MKTETLHYRCRRALQLRNVWLRRLQEHAELCQRAERRCRSCVALYNRVAGMEAVLRVLYDGDWGQ